MAYQVTLLPSGFTFEAEAGERLSAAALRHGIRWPRVCGGVSECGVCYGEVVGGLADDPPAPAERLLLQRVPAATVMEGEIRLACQVCVNRDMEVYRFGVRTPKQAPADSQ